MHLHWLICFLYCRFFFLQNTTWLIETREWDFTNPQGELNRGHPNIFQHKFCFIAASKLAKLYECWFTSAKCINADTRHRWLVCLKLFSIKGYIWSNISDELKYLHHFKVNVSFIPHLTDSAHVIVYADLRGKCV